MTTSRDHRLRRAAGEWVAPFVSVAALIRAISAGESASFDTLNALQGEPFDTFGPTGTHAPDFGPAADRVISAAVDIQHAVAMMEPSDGALAWKTAGLAADAGHHLAAALGYSKRPRRLQAGR